MKVAIDSNILAYVEGVGDAEREERARLLVQGLPGAEVVLPVQVLGELYSVLVRKRRSAPGEARDIVSAWRDSYALAGTSAGVLTAALALAADHGLQIWDAVILAAAAEAGCDVLLSEDMQDGFTWGRVTIVNPFAETPHPLLVRLTQSRG